MKEPLDVKPDEYDLFKEANLAIEEFGIMFEDDEFNFNIYDDDMFDDDLSVEYVSEEDSSEGIGFGDDFSEISSDDGDLCPTEPSPPVMSDGETENGLPDPAVGCGSDRCLVCGHQ